MQPYDQFSALADATRGQIVLMLRQRPHPVHELAAAFSISRPAISRHLRVLKEAGLVTEARQGRENVYRLERKPLKRAAAWLEAQLDSAPVRKPRAPNPAKVSPEPPATRTVPRKPKPEAQQSLFAQMEFEL